MESLCDYPHTKCESKAGEYQTCFSETSCCYNKYNSHSTCCGLRGTAVTTCPTLVSSTLYCYGTYSYCCASNTEYYGPGLFYSCCDYCAKFGCGIHSPISKLAGGIIGGIVCLILVIIIPVAMCWSAPWKLRKIQPMKMRNTQIDQVHRQPPSRDRGSDEAQNPGKPFAGAP
ncbi:uncharacterized protein LOC135502297 isoform X2 [Lineus longissimus]|uniref:uncharacterized protein LOC135502297 isoform X2 n=1 Tax=Lineus longissimus TaxID=88925 RepID=UPI002B4DA30F